MYSDDDDDDDDDKSIFKIKKEHMNMLDKIHDKINNITDVNNIIIKINDESKKKY